MRLKRARLADNLNEKIAQRPGPMELVEKNILPVDSTVKQAIIGETSHHPTRASALRGAPRGRRQFKREVVVISWRRSAFFSVGQVNYPKVLDEDSSDALSPEQPASQESQASVPSPLEGRVPETPSPAPAPPALPSAALQVGQTTLTRGSDGRPRRRCLTILIIAPHQAFPTGGASQSTADLVKVIPATELTSWPAVTPAVTTAAPSKPGPTLVKVRAPFVLWLSLSFLLCVWSLAPEIVTKIQLISLSSLPHCVLLL